MAGLENSFSQIAHVYHRFNNNEVYQDWLDFTLAQLGDQEIGKALDLACGNGVFTRLLAPYCQTILGLDFDPAMLAMAEDLIQDQDRPGISYLCQNMLDLSGLDQDYDIITCYLDSLCFLQDGDRVKQALNQAYQHLSQGGIFLFDVWTSFALDQLDGYDYFDQDDQASLLWQSHLSGPNQICHQLTVFDLVEGDLYRKISVDLEERTYPLEAYLAFLEEAGFALDQVVVYGDGQDQLDLADFDEDLEAYTRWFIKAVK